MRRVHQYFAGAIAAMTLIACGQSPRASTEARCEGYRFDRSGWQATTVPESRHGTEDPDVSDKRVRIARDAVRCGAFNGLTKRQVRTLLGRPTVTDRRYWDYYLAPTLVDDLALFIEFGRKGRVAGAQVGET